jgi:hypothetical protein
MAWNEGIKAFVANEDLAAYRRVKVLSTGKVAYADADTAGDGVTMYEVESGDSVAVKLLNYPGTFEIATAGAIDVSDDVYAAADGKIQGLPVDAGDYYLVGKAFEDATADGEIIEIMPARPESANTVTVG